MKQREYSISQMHQTSQGPSVVYHQQNLFGIRKPITIFYDIDFKNRLLVEEMVAEQSVEYAMQGDGSDDSPCAILEPDSGIDGAKSLKNNCQTHDVGGKTKVAPSSQILQPVIGLPQNSFTKVDYNIKMYYPKKFEVLRKFYCGSHLNFIQSMMSSEFWRDVSGGRTNSPFQKTFDKKYIMKEVKRPELKMFLEFAPQYFDYLCKSFFHDYPCTLAKIVGVYKIKITQYVEKVDMSKSY